MMLQDDNSAKYVHVYLSTVYKSSQKLLWSDVRRIQSNEKVVKLDFSSQKTVEMEEDPEF